MMKEYSEQVDPLYFIAKRPWKNPQPNQPQGFRPQQFAQSSQNNWNPAWQPWAQPQSQSWNQGWKNPYGAYAQYQQYSPSYLPPQFIPPSNQIPQGNQLPQILVQNQNPQISSPFQQKPNQLPTQPLPNPNNKIPQQPVYNMEGPHLSRL
jgi:hypothetical protein